MTTRVKGFRINEKILADLTKESRERKITLSNLVNNILSNHNETYRNLQKLHFVWLSPEFVQTLIALIPEKKFKKISEIYAQDLKNQVLYCHGDLDSNSLMETVENICSSQNVPIHTKVTTKGAKKYTLIHGLGKKWSNVQRHALELIFSEMNTNVSNFVIDGDHISFEVNH